MHFHKFDLEKESKTMKAVGPSRVQSRVDMDITGNLLKENRII